MTTIICNKCRLEIFVGFLCIASYLGENPQERMSWLLQQQIPEKTIHICKSCMDEFLSPREK